MGAAENTLPDLDRRLQEKRGEMAQTLLNLRNRVRTDIREMDPRRQLREHPAAALAAAAVVGLIAGRIAGGLLAVFFD